MAKELVYIDAQGDKQAVDLSLSMYRDAAEKGMSLSQHLASIYPTNSEKHGSAFQQLMEQTGILVRGDKEFGIRPSNIDSVLNPKEAATAITKDGIPASRILFPAVFLEVIEDKLHTDYTINPSGFNQMVAVDDSINGDRFERPVLNFSAPEAARGQAVAQLAMPNVMLSITASDKAMRIPSWGIGLEISEQAMKSTTIDLVGLAVARQAAVEANERANTYILSLLNGDVDVGTVALSSIAGKVVTTTSLDSTLTTGQISQKAWLTWLSNRSQKRVISHIVTDLATAMKIENRIGKPVIVGDNPTSPRMDTLFNVINPQWPSNVKIFLTNDPNWPANTIMGLDQRYGVHRVTSLTAQYSAVEQFVLKRSTAMRVDKGELVYRLFDEAFEVLTLT